MNIYSRFNFLFLGLFNKIFCDTLDRMVLNIAEIKQLLADLEARVKDTRDRL